MHRTTLAPRAASWLVLMGTMLGWILGSSALAQAPSTIPQGPRGKVIIVPVGGTQKLQMATAPGKKLKSALNEREQVARISPIENDPTAVLVTGLEPGTTKVTLINEDDQREDYEVIVQFDVEYLRTVLQRSVPTANVTPIPAANNTIILTGTVARAEDVEVVLRAAQSVVQTPERVINALRVGGVMQVQLDVVVARVSRSEIRRMALDFINRGAQHTFINGTGSAIGLGTFQQQAAGAANSAAAQLRAPVLQTTLGTPNGAPTNLFLAVFNERQQVLTFLQALRDESVVKLLAEPKVVTLSGRSASFLSGGEQAIPVPAGLGQVGVQFEEFGTRLNVLPIVLGNGKIHLEVEPEVSSLNAAFGTAINGTVVPGRETQRVHTTVEMESGQTFAIGGLIQHNVTGTMRKVPVLGDLPFIGVAFSSKFFQEDESELLVLVTPHLVDPLACDQIPKFLPGQESRSPDDFELFLEGVLELPRGPRVIAPNCHYVPGFKSGPTAGMFPCAGPANCGNGGWGKGNCGPAGCNVAPESYVPTTAPVILTPETVPGTLGAASRPLTNIGQVGSPGESVGDIQQTGQVPQIPVAPPPVDLQSLGKGR